MSEQNKKPLLKGIRVVDMARFIAGPVCAMMMADLGAEVIKVEKKGYGDDGRHVGPFKNGKTMYFTTFNRNKKSVEINFRDPVEIGWLEELLKHSDVVIENFRPGTMEKMGLTDERLQEINPRLIVAHISGFGQDGPYKNRAAFDWIIQAMGGIMSLTGTEETGPMVAGLPICDHLAAVNTAFGVTSALYSREQTGKGQVIDVALLNCVVSALQTYIPDYSANGKVAKLTGIKDPLVAPTKRFKTKDGYLYIHAGFDQNYAVLAEHIGDPVLLEEKYKLGANRLAEREIVEGHVEAWTMTKGSDEALDELQGVGVPCGVVADIERICNDAQVLHRRAVVSVETEGIGDVLYPGPPVKFSGQDPIPTQRAPRLGEHNEEVLHGLCGIELPE